MQGKDGPTTSPGSFLAEPRPSMEGDGRRSPSGADLETARRSLALGGLLYRSLSLEEAARLAGVAPATLLADLASMGFPAQSAERLPSASPEAVPRLSVVVPVYNEAANLVALFDRLTMTLAGVDSYEVVFVDDGSSDESPELLERLNASNPAVKVLHLSRNFGHQNALSAGLEWSSGEAVVLMDGDGQDPPELIPRFLELWAEGNDVVFAVRRDRKEARWKRGAYFLFYRLLRALGDVEIPVDAGDFCLMDRRVVAAMQAMPETGRFLRGLRSWVGFRQVGVEYDRPARMAGDPKYTLAKLVKLAGGGIVSFSSVPLRLASVLGFVTSALGVLYVLYAVAERLFVGHTPAGWASIVAVTLLLGGAQLTVIGVLGEYVGRIYSEAKRRPGYVIRSRRW